MKKRINWDALGITASLLCAIHCALLPLIFTSVPVFGVNLIENQALEMAMVALAFLVGGFSFYHGFKKHHQHLLPVTVFAIGFFFLVLKLFLVAYETLLLVPAVAGIICSHIINYRFCQLHRQSQAGECSPTIVVKK